MVRGGSHGAYPVIRGDAGAGDDYSDDFVEGVALGKTSLVIFPGEGECLFSEQADEIVTGEKAPEWENDVTCGKTCLLDSE